MPNHVYVLLTPSPSRQLSALVHSWESFTAKEANRVLCRQGALWQPDYCDRFIRNAEHFERAVGYVEGNPVKAGLCEEPEDWPYSSASARR
jgi:REP element-mobilizing transposase RayT